MDLKLKVEIPEEEQISKDGSVIFKKIAYNTSPLDSNVGISSDYDVVDKRLVEKRNQSSANLGKQRKSSLPGVSLLSVNVDPEGSAPTKNTNTKTYGSSRKSRLERPDKVDEDERIIIQEAARLQNRRTIQITKSKAKASIMMLGDQYQATIEQENDKESAIDEEIELLQSVIEREAEGSSLNGPPSWDKFLADELGMDQDLMQKHAKHGQKKVHIDRAMMENLKGAHRGDEKRQIVFIEEVMAAYHMKDLTSRYGSKGKSSKQYFMEAYDTDTRAELTVDDDTDTKSPFHKYDSKGRELVEHVKRPEEVEEVKKVISSKFGSPIAFRSIEAMSADNLPSETSEPSFWKSLERIQKKYDDVDRLTSLPNILSLCPSSTSTGSSKSSIFFKEEASDEVLGENRILSGSDLQLSDNDPITDKYIEPSVQEVLQSEFVRQTCQRVQHHLELFNAKDPLAYELFGSTYEEVRNFAKLPEEDVAEFEAGNWDPSVYQENEIFNLEPQEKLITRFHIYQKGLLHMAEHFGTIRPLFAEIKQAYEEVLEKCEREWKDLDKERMENLRLKEAYAASVRQTDKNGDRAIMEVKVQAHALQEHVQWQQHTLFSILGMLWKMRQSLKIQTRLVKKTKVIYKTKVETLAKEIVSQQGQSMYESALPGKYTEIMDRFKQIQDPKEVRRILQSARRQLRKAHKQLVVFEADYADTVPRTEYEIYMKKYVTIHNKNKSVIQRCDELKSEIDQIKLNVAKMKSEMYEDVGLDELTGEKPIIYLEPLGIKEDVPVYLRYGQRIVDLKYSRQEASALINDIWKIRVDLLNLSRLVKKAHEDEQEGVASYPDDLQYDMPVISSFPNFVAEYFKQKCDLEESSMEFSYNLVAACRRNQDNVELSQFLGILEGNVNESVYHLFQIELTRITDRVNEKANEGKDNKGYLGFGDSCKLLQEICPNKKEEEVKELKAVMQVVSGARGDWAMVPVATFFDRSDDMGREDNDFVKLLHTQFDHERKVYVHEIYAELLLELGISEKLLEHIDDPAWLTDVSMHIFYAAVTSADPEISTEGLATYLAWVYLGMTALPGIDTLGTRLVDFLKERAHMAYYELEKYDEDQDIEFEDCIRQFKEYDDDESTMDKLDMKKRRLKTKKLKNASLRQVTDRLNAGPFLRFGKRSVVNAMASNLDYLEGTSEAELEELPLHEHRHHHHHHKHGHHHHDGGNEEAKHNHEHHEHRHHHHKKSKQIETLEETI